MARATRDKPAASTSLSAHAQSLARKARRLVDTEADAEDIAQDAMVAALSAPNLFEVVDELGAWLFRVVQRRCIDLLRRDRGRAVAADDEPTLAEQVFPGADPQELAERDELCRAVAQAIDTLEPELRMAIVENAVNGVPFIELAAATGIPMGTLMARKKRGLDRVRAMLRERGF